MSKKNRFCIGIALIFQAVSFALLFVALCRKKKSAADAALTAAAFGGITGASFVYLDLKDKSKHRKAPPTCNTAGIRPPDSDGTADAWEGVYKAVAAFPSDRCGR